MRTMKSPDSPNFSSAKNNGHERRTQSEKATAQEHFSRLDAHSKSLLQFGMEQLKIYRQRDKLDSITKEEEEAFDILLKSIRDTHTQMKFMSNDMSTVQHNTTLSPRVVDQIRTWKMITDGLQSTLRQMQMEFQQLLHLKRKVDLLSLSGSPFEENSKMRRRMRGAADTSARVTDSLLYSRQILIETIQRSSGTLDVLATSSGTVLSNLDELKDQQTVVSYSKKLLGKYGRREWTDKILIWMALIFFFSVVFYIMQKRIF